MQANSSVTLSSSAPVTQTSRYVGKYALCSSVYFAFPVATKMVDFSKVWRHRVDYYLDLLKKVQYPFTRYDSREILDQSK